MGRRQQDFQTIRSEGGLLPMDLLRRILDPKDNLAGTKPEDYGLPKGDRINEAITQSWNRLQRHWTEFRDQAERLTEGTTGTGLTNEKWNLPVLRELGFGFLPTVSAPEINGQTYAISRFHGPAAIHLVGCRLSLDKRSAGARGAASQNPHGLVQEFLNRSDEHLWAILSNGLTFRILRDNEALSRQSYLEFDLEAMFEGELYSDFVLLWLLGHATRFSIKEGERPEGCWLEQWTKIAEEQGTRALESLRGGVEKALQTLGQGFVSHPRNTQLREQLREGSLTLTDLHSQLLRVIYRLIFLFVSEDRQLDGIPVLHPRTNDPNEFKKRERYTKYYSLGRLRDLASGIRGSRHGDLWHQFNLVVGALSGEEAFDSIRGNLNLPILGSFLWDPTSTHHLNTSEISDGPGIELSNSDFLEAIRNLAFIHEGKILRPVDYKNLGSEELGGVYESLLALTPQISGDGSRFTFAEFAGSERKLSGSYYTPDSLVQCLLDTALDPVVEHAIKGKQGEIAESAILNLKVCDPAVGSGHFLVGAAHRLARHLARVRAISEEESEPSPTLYQTALRDVIGHCLYGVDINPMSAELCKVSLWLEALDPGKPLSFLDHHIQVGNSLIGATPDLLKSGIPDSAFSRIEGDDKRLSTLYKKRNREERKHKGKQEAILFSSEPNPNMKFNSILKNVKVIENIPDDSIESVKEKSKQLNALKVADNYQKATFSADVWCASFVLEKSNKVPDAITESIYRKVDHDSLQGLEWLKKEVNNLAKEYKFFHWHLRFPEVHEQGGFDLILGNPPWEKVELLQREWFSARSPKWMATSAGENKRDFLKKLQNEDFSLYSEFIRAVRRVDGERSFIKNSGLYKLCGKGRINQYSAFAELNQNILNSQGLIGCILPPGIATDDSTKEFIQSIIKRDMLRSFYAFTNRGYIFREIESTLSFALVSWGFIGKDTPKIAAQVWQVEHLQDQNRVYSLTPNEISLLNPNTGNLPIFKSTVDASITKRFYERIPVLVNESQNSITKDKVEFRQGLFNMTTDKHFFNTSESVQTKGVDFTLRASQGKSGDFLPLFEAKLTTQYNHRFGTFEGVGEKDRFGTRAQTNKASIEQLKDPSWYNIPRYWVSEEHVEDAVPNRWKNQWLLGFRNAVSAVADSRSVSFVIIPRTGVGNSMPLIFNYSDTEFSALLLGNFNSFVLDYICRQKVSGGNLNFYVVKQLPLLPLKAYSECSLNFAGRSTVKWIIERVVELTYTSWDLKPFAEDMGVIRPPFTWNTDRRFEICAELDALFFHLYLGMDYHSCPDSELEGQIIENREIVKHILETFPIVKKRDIEKYDTYKTAVQILEYFDLMIQSLLNDEPYKSVNLY